MWPYYNEIRHFKNGAFNIAVRNNVPIIPFVFHFVEPYGFRKFFRKKPFVHLDILSPEYPSIDLPKKESIEELKIRVFLKLLSFRLAPEWAEKLMMLMYCCSFF